MDENKTRMKREKIITLLRLVTENGLKIEIAADEICDLFNVSKRLDSEIEKRKKITDTIGCETHRELTEVMKEIDHLRAVSRILKD